MGVVCPISVPALWRPQSKKHHWIFRACTLCMLSAVHIFTGCAQSACLWFFDNLGKNTTLEFWNVYRVYLRQFNTESTKHLSRESLPPRQQRQHKKMGRSGSSPNDSSTTLCSSYTDRRTHTNTRTPTHTLSKYMISGVISTTDMHIHYPKQVKL